MKNATRSCFIINFTQVNGQTFTSLLAYKTRENATIAAETRMAAQSDRIASFKIQLVLIH
jgi:hypothetical protein